MGEGDQFSSWQRYYHDKRRVSFGAKRAEDLKSLFPACSSLDIDAELKKVAERWRALEAKLRRAIVRMVSE